MEFSYSKKSIDFIPFFMLVELDCCAAELSWKKVRFSDILIIIIISLLLLWDKENANSETTLRIFIIKEF